MNLHSKTEEEFSLLILWRIITKYKLMIFIMVILSTLITTFYVYNFLVLKTQYKVSATIHQDYFNLQTLDPHLVMFPYKNSQVNGYKPNIVKDKFLSDLNLDKYKKIFFIKENLSVNKINFSKEFGEKSDALRRTDNIWLIHENVDFAKTLLRNYIIFSEKELINELSINIDKSVANQIFELENKLHKLENMIRNDIDMTIVPAPVSEQFTFANPALKFKWVLNKRYCATVNCSDKALNNLRFPILALKKIKIDNDSINFVASVSNQVKVIKERAKGRVLIITLGLIFSIMFSIGTAFFLNFINTQSLKHKSSTN